jgi:hypothetical protein
MFVSRSSSASCACGTSGTWLRLEKPGDESSLRYRFLTIARDEGSLGDEIALDLSRRLGWHVFDKEIVTYIARNGSVREGLVRQLDQKSQGFLESSSRPWFAWPHPGMRSLWAAAPISR